MRGSDPWAEWLARRRYGDDAELRRRGLEELALWRDRVLTNAGLVEGETLLDVGCGQGLIGFGALERGAGTVVFSDISQDLLELCREAARDLGVSDRCRFMCAFADDLASIEESSVDVVTTRSVLIYVDDKASAFSEFSRVLKPAVGSHSSSPSTALHGETRTLWPDTTLVRFPTSRARFAPSTPRFSLRNPIRC